MGSVVSEIKDNWCGRTQPIQRKHILYMSYPNLEYLETSIKNNIFNYCNQCEYEFELLTEEKNTKYDILKYTYFFIILDKSLLDNDLNSISLSEISEKTLKLMKKIKLEHKYIDSGLIIHEKLRFKFNDLYYKFNIASIDINESDIKKLREKWEDEIEYLNNHDKILNECLNLQNNISDKKETTLLLNENSLIKDILLENINKTDEEIIKEEKEKEKKSKYMQIYGDIFNLNYALEKTIFNFKKCM